MSTAMSCPVASKIMSNAGLPLTSITRDILQQMIGQGMTEQDFSTLILAQAKASGIELKPENVPVGDGLSS